MKKLFLLLAAVLILIGVSPLQAADLALSQSDCEQILQRWAEDPTAVSSAAVDRCRESAGTAVPAAVAAGGLAGDTADGNPEATAADPCGGAAGAGSVDCWGPWGALAPAATADVGGAAPDFAEAPELESRPELSSVFDKEVDPLLVVACTAGLPCGYATLVAGNTGFADAESTELVAFELAEDGSAFIVDPDGNSRIDSATGLSTTFVMHPDGYENLRARGAEGDSRSRLAARVIRVPSGDILLAADAWSNAAANQVNSGFFAWGRAIDQSDLDALNNSTVSRSIAFSGPMSVDNSTQAAITVNFGTSPDWSGNWTNPGYNFSAGGSLRGVELVSDDARFSENVQADSFVQGALLGEPGNRGIAHAIDVTLENVGRIKDVGLLTETVTQPVTR